MDRLTKLSDLTPAVYKQYLLMAETQPKKVKAYMSELIVSADAEVEEEYVHFRFYDRAYSLITECNYIMSSNASERLYKSIVK